MNEHEDQDRKPIPFGQILFDDVFLLLLLGLILPFIIYTVWGLMDIGGIPTLPPTDFEPTTAVVVDTDQPPQIDGEVLAQSIGCVGCHSVNGGTSVGPGWQGIYGTTRTLADGSTVEVDDVYLRNSIINPNDQVAEGYVQGLMPSYDERFSGDEIAALIEYIESLK